MPWGHFFLLLDIDHATEMCVIPKVPYGSPPPGEAGEFPPSVGRDFEKVLIRSWTRDSIGGFATS